MPTQKSGAHTSPCGRFGRFSSVAGVFLCCLFLALAGCKATVGKWTLDFGKKTPQEESVPAIRVAMLAPLPLPDSVRLAANPHGKVLTGEFYSDQEALDYSDGYFIPNEYLFIIRKNLGMAAELRRLEMDMHESLAGIERGEYDMIVFPAVVQARVDSDARVGLEVRLVDGSTFLPLRTVVVEKQEGKYLSDPLHEPVHFIGKHEKDFQNQRTLFSYTAYLCAQDVINEIIKGGGA